MANYHPCVQIWLYPPLAGIQRFYLFEIMVGDHPDYRPTACVGRPLASALPSAAQGVPFQASGITG